MPATALLDITLRDATAADASALRDLAALDSARALTGDVVVAAAHDGDLRAAVSLTDGRAVADPFHPTAALVDLLRTHASARTAVAHGRRRRRRLARPAFGF